MKCDLAGLLQNARKFGNTAEHREYYEFCIDELINNLREVKRRHLAGDTKVLDEFFDIYVLETEKAKEGPCPPS